MKHSLRIALTLFALVVAAGTAFANADIMISEYVEGTSNNKGIELFNITGAGVDLAAGGYKIRIFSNGAATPTTTINLTGILPNLGTFVLANTLASFAGTADQTSAGLDFNGDDAVQLVKSAANTSVDVIGQIGFDPGTEWGAGLVSTMDNTIRRKADVCKGDPIGDDAFDPSIQWDGFATDDFTGLDAHTTTCAPTPVSAGTWGRVKTLYR